MKYLVIERENDTHLLIDRYIIKDVITIKTVKGGLLIEFKDQSKTYLPINLGGFYIDYTFKRIY